MTNTLSFPSQSAALKSAADTILSRKPKLDWKPVDVETLPPDLRALYDDFRAAQALANERRQAFEDAICGPLAKLLSARPGQDVAFTYRFGLAVALTDKPTPSTKSIRF